MMFGTNNEPGLCDSFLGEGEGRGFLIVLGAEIPPCYTTTKITILLLKILAKNTLILFM
jgi:hypothetical protein